MIRTVAFALSIMTAAPVAAQPLTIRTGETWIFQIAKGQPARARRAAPSAALKPGEIKASVNAMMGTTMTVSSGARIGYSFRAELIRGRKAQPARSCTLPPGGRPILENWPVKADAVRISDFRPSNTTNC